MARLARIVLPDVPHHVTQRGNGKEQTFFSEGDYQLYLDLLFESCAASEVKILGWCLMPNHVHLALVPADEDGLRRALAPVHRRYAGEIHKRFQKRGHFWQGRFGCVAMDDDHLVAALSYIVLNPVRAKLVSTPEEWDWSSVHAYANGGVGGEFASAYDANRVEPVLGAVRQLVSAGGEDERFKRLRKSETIGRPLGDDAFMRRAEKATGKSLVPAKRGRKPTRVDEPK